MRKFKKILGVFVVMVLAVLVMPNNVNAESYSTVLTGEYRDYSSDELKIEFKISSNELSSNSFMNFNPWEYTHIEKDYNLYAGYLYNYQLVDPDKGGEVTSVNEDFEILIHMEGLTLNDEYDIYFVKTNPETNKNIVDKEKLGTVAKVVDVDGKLYIRFLTKNIQSFFLFQEMSDEYADLLEHATTNGVYTLPAIEVAPYDGEDNMFDPFTYFMALENLEKDMVIEPLTFGEDDELLALLEFKSLEGEKHVVKYNYKEKNIPSAYSNKVEEIINNIQDNFKEINEDETLGVELVVEDLNYVNFLVNNDDDEHNKIATYSHQLKDIIGNTNFKFHFDMRKGSDQPLEIFGEGFMIFEYDKILFPISFDARYFVKQVLYIPESTEDTDEAIINALKDRITKYLEVEDINIEVGGTTDDIIEYFGAEEGIEKYYDRSAMTSNYYNVEINGKEVLFLVEKNDDKVKNLEFVSTDLKTDVQINSSSGQVPLDTLIEVEKLTSGEEYERIIEILDVEENETFDLKLYSESQEKYITKLENGKFEVRIPLSKTFEGKKLIVYYVDEEGKTTEHDVTVKDGYATFVTDHFSIYTLAENLSASGVEVPDTFDGFINYILIGILSLMGMIGTAMYLKKVK